MITKQNTSNIRYSQISTLEVSTWDPQKYSPIGVVLKETTPIGIYHSTIED
jgi:hypothetical protein